jgi:hypothetical protein
MRSQIFKALQNLSIVLSIALAWLGVFNLNMWLFTSLNYSERADWIFMPAALRVLAVLIFSEIGAFGLAVGAYLTLSHASDSHPMFEIALAATSGLAPLLGLQMCRRIVPLARDLSGLDPKGIIVLSIATAVANSLLVNACLALSGKFDREMIQLITIFVGDVVGSAIVLVTISAGIDIFHKFRQ